MSGDGATAAIPPHWQIARLMDSFLTTQALYIAAKLGVADVLAAGPQTGREVAEAVGADPDALTRVLRGLVLEDVLAEEGDGRFALTPLGACLRDVEPEAFIGVPKAQAYNGTFYLMCGLLGVGLVANLLVRPVHPKHHVKETPSA